MCIVLYVRLLAVLSIQGLSYQHHFKLLIVMCTARSRRPSLRYFRSLTHQFHIQTYGYHISSRPRPRPRPRSPTIFSSPSNPHGLSSSTLENQPCAGMNRTRWESGNGGRRKLCKAIIALGIRYLDPCFPKTFPNPRGANHWNVLVRSHRGLDGSWSVLVG